MVAFLGSRQFFDNGEIEWKMFSIILIGGFVSAWVWWSTAIPKWRLWAYRRVDDIPLLKQKAVAAMLTWPDGHFFERTEIKSKSIERSKRPLKNEERHNFYE